MTGRIEIAAGDYRLVAEPARGGSLAAFEWRGEPLFRATCGPSILDTACFPLVPFSNRIADGRFVADGGEVRIAPNFPGGGQPHPLHGFGWLAEWEVVEHAPDAIRMRHRYQGGEWPWRYQAEQHLRVSGDGLCHRLSVRNLGESAMPAGIGLHPYLPRTERTGYRGLHRGEWRTAPDGLPITLRTADEPLDWWRGRPVASRTVDTVYAGRSGDLVVDWPERSTGLAIRPDATLPFTVVYSPADAPYFCVEPVSHATNAINRDGEMPRLAPGEALCAEVRYTAYRLAGQR